MCKHNVFYLILLLSLSFLTYHAEPAACAAMRLDSPAFAPNARIPIKFTCSGEGGSPALSWRGVPASAKALALIIEDPDAPSGNFIHWVIFDIPPAVDSMPAAVPVTPKTAFGAIQGRNGRGDIGYTGPCPPPGKNHHYHFRLYAIDQNLALSSDAYVDQVEAAMRGHIVGEAELVGVFSR